MAGGAGAVTGFAGGILQASAASDASAAAVDKYRTEQDLNNFNARQTLLQTAEEVRQQKVMGRKAIGSIRSAIGASGIQAEGSVLDVLEESAANSKLDELKIQHAGDLKAFQYRMGAAMAAKQSSAAVSAGNLGIASGILSGLGSMSSGPKAGV